MTKVDYYRTALAGLDDWTSYLASNSGLPGPRGNLELVAACGEEADGPRAEQLIATDDEFATVCGVVALGRHLGAGDQNHVGVLRTYASDERWRVREGVARPSNVPVTTIPTLLHADLVATDHLAADDKSYERLREHFDDGDLVELCAHIAVCVGFGRIAATWDLVDALPDAFRADDASPWFDGATVR